MILHKASKTLIKLIQGIEQLIRIMTTFAHFSPLDKSLDERGFRIEYQLEPFYRKVSDLIDFILFMSGHITVVLVVLVCKCYREFRRLVTHVSSPSASLAAALAQSTEPWPNLRNLTVPLSEQVVEDQFSDQKLP